MTDVTQPGTRVRRIAGYAAVFNHPDSGSDIILPGAFRRLANAPADRAIPLLWQHDVARPIGRVIALREDAVGLMVLAQIAVETRTGADADVLLKSGALSGLSFGYRVRHAEQDAARRVRRLIDVDLFEVSLVTFPMQPRARVLQLE